MSDIFPRSPPGLKVHAPPIKSPRCEYSACVSVCCRERPPDDVPDYDYEYEDFIPPEGFPTAKTTTEVYPGWLPADQESVEDGGAPGDEAGAQGQPGPSGYQGEPGLSEEEDDSEAEGPQEQSDSSFQGPEGAQGQPGPSGNPSEAGPAGPLGPGLSPEQEDLGPEGPQGRAGSTDPQGETGGTGFALGPSGQAGGGTDGDDSIAFGPSETIPGEALPSHEDIPLSSSEEEEDGEREVVPAAPNSATTIIMRTAKDKNNDSELNLS